VDLKAWIMRCTLTCNMLFYNCSVQQQHWFTVQLRWVASVTVTIQLVSKHSKHWKNPAGYCYHTHTLVCFRRKASPPPTSRKLTAFIDVFKGTGGRTILSLLWLEARRGVKNSILERDVRWMKGFMNFHTHTAKKHYQKFKINIPRKGIAWPQSQSPHSCVCERFIHSHYRSAYYAAGK